MDRLAPSHQPRVFFLYSGLLVSQFHSLVEASNPTALEATGTPAWHGPED